jgi:phosphoribosylanthranilate isomerase
VIVKVCGVRTAEIAISAETAGADWIGIVFEPRSVRYADDVAAREVAGAVSSNVDLVGVFVSPSVQECDQAADRYGLAAVQVHGEVAPEFAHACSVPVIRGLNVRAEQEAYTLPWWPDLLVLLDAAPDGTDGLPGGTGKRVPLEVAREVARHRRILLAGGLGGDSVAAAIEAVRPYGVDASSGLESAPGVKDSRLVQEYVVRARAAFERVGDSHGG